MSASERPPARLKPPWAGVWRNAQRHLEASGSWSLALRPLLDEYVDALRRARDLRPGADADPANAGWLAADRESRRALQIATTLGLVPKRPVGRPRKQEEADGGQAEGPADAFAELDELAPRRQQRRAKKG